MRPRSHVARIDAIPPKGAGGQDGYWVGGGRGWQCYGWQRDGGRAGGSGRGRRVSEQDRVGVGGRRGARGGLRLAHYLLV